jgi:hypothetical protein
MITMPPRQGKEFVKNSPKKEHSPSHILSELVRNLYGGEKHPTNVRYFCTQFSKKTDVNNSTLGEKFAKSGHPGKNLTDKNNQSFSLN